jgi:hypothetical protein
LIPQRDNKPYLERWTSRIRWRLLSKKLALFQ